MKLLNCTLFTLFFFSVNGYTQESTTKLFDLYDLIELVDKTKEETHEWLIKDDLFTLVMQKEKYDGYVYGLNYNINSKIASIWLHKYYEIEELYVIGGKDDLHEILEQLAPHMIESNIINGSTSISSYSYKEKGIIVQIRPDKPVSIKIVKTSDN